MSSSRTKFFDILSLNIAREKSLLLSKTEKKEALRKKILTLFKIYDRIIGGKKELLPKKQFIQNKKYKN